MKKIAHVENCPHIRNAARQLIDPSYETHLNALD